MYKILFLGDGLIDIKQDGMEGSPKINKKMIPNKRFKGKCFFLHF